MSLFGTAIGTARVIVTADTSTFAKQVSSGVTQAVGQVSASTSKLTGLAGIGQDLFKPLAEGAVVAGVAVVDLGAKLQTAQAGLRAAVDQVDGPGAFQNLQPQIAAVEKQLTSLGSTNAQTDSGLARLTVTTGSLTTALKAYPAIVEVARATQHNLTQETKDFIDASNGNYVGLERTGVLTKEQAKNFGSFADAVDFLTKKYGPLAEAQSKTFGGQLAADKASITNLGASFGEDLIPYVEKAGTVLRAGAGFLEQHRTVATDLAVVVGGALTAALGAFAIAEAKIVATKAVDFFTSLGSGAQSLSDRLRGTTVATQDNADAQIGQAEAASRTAIATESLAEAVDLLIAPLTDAAVATVRIAAGFDAVVAVAARLDATAIGTGTAVEELTATQRLAAESAAEWAAEEDLLGASVTRARAAMVEADTTASQLAAAEAQAAEQATALGEGFQAAAGQASSFQVELGALGEEMTVVDGDMATLGADAEVSAAKASTAFSGLAGKLGAVALAITGVQAANSAAGSAATSAATPFVQGEDKKIAALGSTQAKIAQVKRDLADATNTSDRFSRNLQTLGGNSGFVSAVDHFANAVPVLHSILGTIQGIDASSDSAGAKIKALQEVLAGLNAQQAAASSGPGAGGVDAGGLAAIQDKLNSLLGDGTGKATTLAAALAAVDSAEQKLDNATTTLAADEQKVIDAENTLKDAHQAVANAALTLAVEQKTVSDVMHDTGDYAITLAGNYNSVAQAATALQSAQVNLALAQQTENGILTDSGQYALDVANAENKAAGSATNLLAAQTALAQQTQTWNAIQTDTGTYLEDQQKAQLALAQAQQQQVQAAEAAVTAQNNLNNLQTSSQATLNALAEAHGNVALAQELSNIQQGDASQNQTALQAAQNALTNAQLQQQQATLAVTDAQTNLNNVNNEAIPGTVQYQQALVALQQAQQAVAGAATQQTTDQRALQNTLNEAIPGTLQYEQQQLALQQAQQAVANAANSQNSAQAQLQKTLNEAVPGTLEYRQLIGTLTNDTNAYDTALQNVAKDTEAIAVAQNDVAKALLAQQQASAALTAQNNQLYIIENQIQQLYNQANGAGANGAPFGISKYTSLPARAGGGPVTGGSPYIVGEAGKELFVPNTSGIVIPNNLLTGNGSGGSGLSVDTSSLAAPISAFAAATQTLAGTLSAPGGGALSAAGPLQVTISPVLNITGGAFTGSPQDLAAIVTGHINDQVVPLVAGAFQQFLQAGS